MNTKDKILSNYKNLMADIDARTSEVYARAPEIPCKNKCYECCKQLFPISFSEAFYISEGFKTLPRSVRREREKAAQKIQKKILAQNPFAFVKKTVDKTSALKTHSEFANFLHSIESDCPALDPDNVAGACTVYDFRNHDCRTMGSSFDSSENSIVGCFRFKSLPGIVPKLMDFNYKYSQKMELDRKLIAEVTGGVFTQNILYFTTVCGPLLKDYSTTNWIQFFETKGIPTESNPSEFFVVIDC